MQAVEFMLRAATTARPPIPIVMAAINIDPVAKGFVQSLAHPGGNITGLDRVGRRSRRSRSKC